MTTTVSRQFFKIFQKPSFNVVLANPKYYSSSLSKDIKEYDLVVLGGGSGGISCAVEARSLGASVALLDYVTPSPQGSTWGIGGTCVNVGCIPKKLMHHAALLGEAIADSEHFGWTRSKQYCPIENNWSNLILSVNNHIKSVNWLTRVSLRDSKIDYINGLGKFLDAHTIEATQQDGTKIKIKGKNILISVGGRPKYLDIPGAREYGLTSDDIFSWPKIPQKTLIVGGGYVALECAGFLKGLHYPVTLMIRDKILRGFDQQMANLIRDELKENGVNFLKPARPLSLEKTSKGTLAVKYVTKNEERVEEFDTVLFAVGRKAATDSLNLNAAGIKTDLESGKIEANQEQTSIPHIYAVGDVLKGKPELTPVAIQAGKLLARRLFANSKGLMDYDNVATTVFTPLEYGCVGLSEEKAIDRHGIDNIEVYHSFFKPTEYAISQKSFAQCYLKAICKRNEPRTILGLHFLGPHAGEVMQGYAVAIKAKATMDQLMDTVGIHPTVSEEFTRLFITKRSGLDPSPQICCS